MLPVTIYSYLYDNSIIFIVGDDKITIKEGIFFKKTKIIPYSSVQSVDIKSGMLKSWMQLRVVNIWTGSQEQVGVKEISPDGALMLSAEDAEWLASHIVSNKNR
ncbi:PH domain-containing protein [bacterium]|nr:PH domain-containing protein [bacterium]